MENKKELTNKELFEIVGGATVVGIGGGGKGGHVVDSPGTPPADKLLATGQFFVAQNGGITNGHVEFYAPTVEPPIPIGNV